MTLQKLFRRNFTDPGAAPGSFDIAASVPPPAIHAIAYSPADLIESDVPDIPSAMAMTSPDRRLWIDIQGRPTKELLDATGATFGFHHLALADVANIGQRPKIEDYGEFLFCVLRMATATDTGYQWEQVSLFITKQIVVSFQERPGDCFDSIRNRLRTGRKNIRSGGGDYLGAMLMDAIVDGYFPLLEEYGERLETLETRVLRDPSRAVLSQVYHAKRELMSFRRAIWPLRDALNHLLRDGHALFKKATVPYLRDTVDHLMQVVEVVENFRELAGSFIDVYLSSVSHRTNEVMRVLTIGATIFIPLTFVAGIYGMNFEVIPELKWKHGYLYFWGIVGLMLIGMVFLFHHLGWLRKPETLDDDK